MKKIMLFLFTFCLALSLSEALDVIVFGPQQFIRTSGKKNVYNLTFTSENGPAKLIVFNGDELGNNRNSSAIIYINDTKYVSQSDLNKNIYQIDLDVILSETNDLIIELASEPGSYITVEIIQECSPNNFDIDVLGISWISIPEGEFTRGDNFYEGRIDELPVHSVYLDEYSISKYEITFDQYDFFCEETGREKPSDSGWGRGTRPVINVDWNDANDFCIWLSNKTCKNIHLPTEAQWEKAARGNDQRRFAWGNEDPTCDIARFKDCGEITDPVDFYPLGQSSYGVFNMTGNVWEWCQDWYDESYYSSSPYFNPMGPPTGTERVFRGGGCTTWWRNLSLNGLRAANRDFSLPTRIFFGLGFRIAQD